MFKGILVGFFVGLLFLSAGCGSESAAGEDPDISDSLATDRITEVQVSLARNGVFQYRIACNGDVRAAATYQVSAQTPG